MPGRVISARRADAAVTVGPGSHVVVIGAGLSGLSAALWLRACGCEVTVVEREPFVGGLVRTESIDGSHFDTGATVLTMPQLVADALTAVGIPEDEAWRRLDLKPVEPTYRARFADGTAIAVPRNPEALYRAVTGTFGTSAATGVRRLQDWLAQLHDVEFEAFIDRDLAGLRSLCSRETLIAAAHLIRMGAACSLASAVADRVDDPRLQRIFTFQALYAGVPPRVALAVYGVIAHMDIGLGVTHPTGGMARVGEVMADALTEVGGRLLLSTPAQAIATTGHRATHVEAGTGTERCMLPADAVVSTVPTPTTAALLGRPLPRGPRWRRIRYSPSAVVIHGRVPVSVTRSWPTGHHTIDFGAAWNETFIELTRSPGSVMTDPSFLVTRPAVTDPATFTTETPYGIVESVSVLAPCPNLDVARLHWDRIAEAYAAECLAVLERRGHHGISAMDIVGVDHPGTWAARGLPAGTPFSAAHTAHQTGPLRTPRRWAGIANVVLAGGSTTPGVGIPPVVVSGRLAAQRLTGEAAMDKARARTCEVSEAGRR